MRRNNLLVLLVIGLMLCSIMTLQAGVDPARAASGNLADEAVNYLYNQYLDYGITSGGLGNNASYGSYDASYCVYILRSAGVDLSKWENNDVVVTDAVYSLANQDAGNTSATAKSLAQDLVAMQALGKDTTQLQQILLNRQSSTGFDQGEYSAYSNLPAYDLLGRAGKLGGSASVYNAVYARSYILAQQGTDGSWAFDDFLSTAEAVRALSYLDPAKSDTAIQQAITSGCSWLKLQQQPGGSFTASIYDDPLIDTAEAIATQKVLGLDPTTAWTNGGSAVAYLEANALNSDGSFGSSENVMDATWALDALHQLSQTPQAYVYFIITPDSSALTVGGTVQLAASQLNASLQGADVTKSTTWSVANDVYASVDNNGLVTAMEAGTTTVTAVYDGLTALTSLTVQAPGGDGGSSGTSVGVAVVGLNGQMIYGPSTVVISSSDKYGLTALGALVATGLQYVAPNGNYGIWVTNIDGLANGSSGSTVGWMFTVNDAAPSTGPAVTTVANGDHVIWYYTESMNQIAPTWAGLTSGSSGGTTGSGVTSTTGSAAVDPAAGGTVGLGSNASVNIPAGALNGTASATVAIQQVNNPPSAPAGFSLLGSVYEFTVGGSTGYSFAKPVTLTFTFDPTAVPAGETPAVYYYDETKDQWVSLGGTVSGSTITVTVDHFTKFAVLAGKATTPAGPATASATAPATAARFTDVPASLWAYGDIESLSGLGCISGYPDGSFKPGNTITRAEFISILDKALKLAAYNPAAPDFSDVGQGDWCYGSVEDAVYAGIVKGYGGAFKPDDPVTREEMAVILVKALDEQGQAGSSMNSGTAFTDNASISAWAKGFVAVAVQDGLIKGYPGDNTFRPKSAATRAEACAMIMNFMNARK